MSVRYKTSVEVALAYLRSLDSERMSFIENCVLEADHALHYGGDVFKKLGMASDMLTQLYAAHSIGDTLYVQPECEDVVTSECAAEESGVSLDEWIEIDVPRIVFGHLNQYRR